MQELLPVEAYLDIETTGLSRTACQITVVGLYLVAGASERVVQLVGPEITASNLAAALAGVRAIYTYNGSRFDLPFIHCHLGLSLEETHNHSDLMYGCWQNNLYGGLKSVERQLNIKRKLTEVNGYEAVRLWWRYARYGDRNALVTLLAYNREDVVNLKLLRERLL